MIFKDCIAKLQIAFNKPLPGYDAQQLLAPVHRKSTSFYLERNPSYKTGCVMIILFPVNQETHLLMIERSDVGTHSGQISFPGGRREMDDANLMDVALRETYEEVGVNPSTIKFLGALTELYIPVSNYLVHSFVGFIDQLPELIINTTEVKKVLTPQLKIFLNHKGIATHDFSSYDGQVINAPYYAFQDYKIWGASAMIISELCILINSSSENSDFVSSF